MVVSTLAIADYGEAALMVTVVSPDREEREREIRAFRDRVLQEPPPGFEDAISGLESLLVEFDPLVTSSEQVAYSLGLLGRSVALGDAAVPTPRRFTIPLVIDDETAPDLADVAAEIGVDVEDLVTRIERSTFSVALLAAAMAPMMTGFDVPRPVRRQAAPRTNVPAGSVMVAGRNAIIQPFPGPTGWRVVGRTPLRIVDIVRDPPVSFAPGDLFCFRRVDARAAEELDGQFLEGDS